MKRPVKVKPIASEHPLRVRALQQPKGAHEPFVPSVPVESGEIRQPSIRALCGDMSSPAQRVIRGVRRDLRDGSHVRPGHSNALAPQLMALPLLSSYAATVIRVRRVG